MQYIIDLRTCNKKWSETKFVNPFKNVDVVDKNTTLYYGVAEEDVYEITKQGFVVKPTWTGDVKIDLQTRLFVFDLDDLTAENYIKAKEVAKKHGWDAYDSSSVVMEKHKFIRESGQFSEDLFIPSKWKFKVFVLDKEPTITIYPAIYRRFKELTAMFNEGIYGYNASVFDEAIEAKLKMGSSKDAKEKFKDLTTRFIIPDFVYVFNIRSQSIFGLPRPDQVREVEYHPASSVKDTVKWFRFGKFPSYSAAHTNIDYPYRWVKIPYNDEENDVFRKYKKVRNEVMSKDYIIEKLKHNEKLIGEIHKDMIGARQNLEKLKQEEIDSGQYSGYHTTPWGYFPLSAREVFFDSGEWKPDLLWVDLSYHIRLENWRDPNSGLHKFGEGSARWEHIQFIFQAIFFNASSIRRYFPKNRFNLDNYPTNTDDVVRTILHYIDSTTDFTGLDINKTYSKIYHEMEAEMEMYRDYWDEWYAYRRKHFQLNHDGKIEMAVKIPDYEERLKKIILGEATHKDIIAPAIVEARKDIKPRELMGRIRIDKGDKPLAIARLIYQSKEILLSNDDFIREIREQLQFCGWGANELNALNLRGYYPMYKKAWRQYKLVQDGKVKLPEPIGNKPLSTNSTTNEDFETLLGTEVSSSSNEDKNIENETVDAGFDIGFEVSADGQIYGLPAGSTNEFDQILDIVKGVRKVRIGYVNRSNGIDYANRKPKKCVEDGIISKHHLTLSNFETWCKKNKIPTATKTNILKRLLGLGLRDSLKVYRQNHPNCPY